MTPEQRAEKTTVADVAAMSFNEINELTGIFNGENLSDDMAVKVIEIIHKHAEQAIKDAVEEAHSHLRVLLKTANHKFYGVGDPRTCQFDYCTCGKATEHSDAQLDANKYLKEV